MNDNLFSTFHTPRENYCQEFDVSACARFHDKWRVVTRHPESICSTTSEQTTDKGLSCAYVHPTSLNHLWFSLDYYQNTHSTHYRCTHYTLLLIAWCFQSVCSTVTLWRIILPINSSPLVRLVVNIPPEPHQAAIPVRDFLMVSEQYVTGSGRGMFRALSDFPGTTEENYDKL
jgi:hypothetical protein